jgi:hypothetical protein
MNFHDVAENIGFFGFEINQKNETYPVKMDRSDLRKLQELFDLDRRHMHLDEDIGRIEEKNTV